MLPTPYMVSGTKVGLYVNWRNGGMFLQAGCWRGAVNVRETQCRVTIMDAGVVENLKAQGAERCVEVCGRHDVLLVRAAVCLRCSDTQLRLGLSPVRRHRHRRKDSGSLDALP